MWVGAAFSPGCLEKHRAFHQGRNNGGHEHHSSVGRNIEAERSWTFTLALERFVEVGSTQQKEKNAQNIDPGGFRLTQTIGDPISRHN